MKDILKVLKKYPDYTAIAHATGLCCPEGDMDFMADKPNLVGWCETNIGHMMVTRQGIGTTPLTSSGRA